MGKIVVGSHGEDVCGRDPSDSAQRTYRFGMALENAWEPVNRATEVGSSRSPANCAGNTSDG